MSRVLAIDYGKVRLGLAVSDAERRIASPLVNYTRKGAKQDAAFLREILETEEIGVIVVGLPVHLNGSEGVSAKAARTFGAWLEEETGRACVYYDERFTSVMAESSLWQAGLTHKKRLARRDQVAAQMLLQAFIDAGCPAEETPGALDGSNPG